MQNLKEIYYHYSVVFIFYKWRLLLNYVIINKNYYVCEYNQCIDYIIIIPHFVNIMCLE